MHLKPCRNLSLILLPLLACATPALAASPAELEAKVRAVLANPAVQGTRWGLRVEDREGHVVASIAADERFQPASNTKVFMTSAVFDAMTRGPFPNPGTQVRLEKGKKGLQDVVLVGRGDARLADTPDCQRDCLAELADAVKASGVKRVGDVVGDDTFMPFERWVISEELRPGRRTIFSALTLNDNEFTLTVQGGAKAGDPVVVDATQIAPEYPVVNEVRTGPADAKAEVQVEMVPATRVVRLFGTLPAGGKAEGITLDVDDPADFAAMRFARLLRARGIKVTGAIRPRHAPLVEGDLFGTSAPAPEQPALASLTPPDVLDTLTVTNKVSQNLYAHLFLKKLALAAGQNPTTSSGLLQVEQVIAKAGLPRWTHDFYDGSGLSPDNMITPRAMVAYLHWIETQPWAADFRKTLPIAGVDGTLRRRMKGTPLEGKLFAKTGTLLATNALTGFMNTASGKELTFAIYASERPSSAPSVLPTLDAALNVIAAEN